MSAKKSKTSRSAASAPPPAPTTVPTEAPAAAPRNRTPGSENGRGDGRAAKAARGQKSTAARSKSSARPIASALSAEFSVLDTLAGKSVLIIGGTGFLGRIMLYHFLKFVPDIGHVFVLVRPTHGRTGAERLEQEILGSPVFSTNGEDPDFFRAATEEKVTVVEGDAAREGLALEPNVAKRIRATVDVVLNTAGNVDFNPPLDVSLSANAVGVRNVLDFVESTQCRRYVHVSTCFVADRGVHRDSSPEEVVSDRVLSADGVEHLIDPEHEIEEALLDVERTKDNFDTPERALQWKARAKQELERMGRQTSDRMVERIAGNLRTFELREELIRVGRERAQRLNRPNVYTYTKTLAELLTHARRDRIEYTILRPSIVETSLKHPFPGWNEGIQGSAPIIYLTYRGHRMIPSISDRPNERTDGTLDLVPVDLVATGTILATCALLRGEHKAVYQAAAGPLDPPMTLTRTSDLTMLTLRDRLRDEERGPLRWWKLNVSVKNVTKETFDRFSTPRTIRMLEKARGRIEKWKDRLPPAVQGAADKAAGNLQRYENLSRLKQRIFNEYLPFINHGYPVFENQNLKELSRRLPTGERHYFGFAPHEINYAEYFRMHVDAIARWVFPVLEKRVNAVFREVSADSRGGGGFFSQVDWSNLDGGERLHALRREAGKRLKNFGDRIKEARKERRERSTQPVDFAGKHLERLTGTSAPDLRNLATAQAEQLAAHFSFVLGETITAADLQAAGTTARFERQVNQLLEMDRPGSSGRLPAEGLDLPDWAADPVKDLCYQIQMQFYRNVVRADVHGSENVPRNHNNVIIVANHSSHLDYGLVWYALGDYGKNMGILAARDYFFSNFWNSTFFRNFHNLIPFERELKAGTDEAIRPAMEFMRNGGPLLIFPEGTRSADGRMQSFRQGLGTLVQKTGADVLPAFIKDTHRALPKGKGFWHVLRHRNIGIRFGQVIPNRRLLEETKEMSPTKRSYTLTKQLEDYVRALAH